jgi:hypothetical protein
MGVTEWWQVVLKEMRMFLRKMLLESAVASGRTKNATFECCGA